MSYTEQEARAHLNDSPYDSAVSLAAPAVGSFATADDMSDIG